MSSQLQKLENNTAKLEITVSHKDFAKGLQKAYLKNKKKYSVPGFRKGKVPYKVLENYYGEAIFYEDAINMVCPDAYQKAIEEHNIEPVDSPEIDIEHIGAGDDFVFTAQVTVKPDVELGEYKGIEVEKVEYNVKEEDVDKQLEQMQESNARLIAIEDRAVQDGDIVTIDFKGSIDGEEFEGGKAENQPIEIGKGNFIPGFEEQIVGMEHGEEGTIKVKFPEDYHAKEFAGKEAEFEIKVKEIKEKELPELDDEFAKDVSEFDTLDELKKDAKEKLEEAAKNRSKQQMENALIEKVAANANVDIPEAMVNNKVDDMVREFELTLMYQGMRLDDYLSMVQMTMEDFKEKFRDDAYNIVKNMLVLEKIGKAEEIKVSDEDIEEEYKKLAEQYKQDVDKVKQSLSPAQKESIESSLQVRNIIDFLFDNCKIVEKKKVNEDDVKQEV
ncbi:MAG: trigger factor [Clostridia bacterium]|nr:trigger factor [Clostridia bacterium]